MGTLGQGVFLTWFPLITDERFPLVVYEVPESKRSVKQNQFLFKVPGDRKQYGIPKAKYLPVGVIEKMSLRQDELTLVDILALFEGGDKTASDAIRTLDGEQLMQLTSAWQEDSGISAGESSASTDS